MTGKVYTHPLVGEHCPPKLGTSLCLVHCNLSCSLAAVVIPGLLPPPLVPDEMAEAACPQHEVGQVMDSAVSTAEFQMFSLLHMVTTAEIDLVLWAPLLSCLAVLLPCSDVAECIHD